MLLAKPSVRLTSAARDSAQHASSWPGLRVEDPARGEYARSARGDRCGSRLHWLWGAISKGQLLFPAQSVRREGRLLSTLVLTVCLPSLRRF